MTSRQKIYLLSLGHVCADLNQGALSALLPFLIASYYFSYSKASSLVLVANFIGALVQPLIGYYSDRHRAFWTVPLGLLLGGGGMALLGYSSSFAMLVVGVLISGIGVALFHPQAVKSISSLSAPSTRGKSLSLFSFGGNLGFSLGPLVTTAVISSFGLKGSLFFFVPQVVMAILYQWAWQEDGFNQVQSQETLVTEKRQDNWLAFGKLCLLVFSRSIVLYGLNTFLALYYITTFSQSKETAGMILSAFFLCSALSTLLGGYLSDKYGKLLVVRWSFGLLVCSLVGLLLSQNIWLASSFLLPLAMSLSLSYSPMILLGQGYLPNHAGLASGVTLGVAVSIGGLFAPVLGMVADRFGIGMSFRVMAIVGLIGFLASFLLKIEQKK